MRSLITNHLFFRFAFLAAGRYNYEQQQSGFSTYGEAGSGGYYSFVQENILSRINFSQLISQGEGQTVEFKKSLSLGKEALISLCAMVNSDVGQGTVAFGIDPSGSVSGIEPGNLDKAQLTLSQEITNNFDPPLNPEIWTETVGGKTVILISAKRLRTVPYYEYTGRAWTRQGSENRQLKLAEKDHLRKCRDRSNHPGPWKCDRCGAVVGQLISMNRTDKGIEKTYNCDCGGQFWPV